MGKKSTPFLSYRDINTCNTDLFEDAFGLYPRYRDVIDLLNLVKIKPGKRLIARVMDHIREKL
jgi:hypothetical protein